MVKEKMQLWYYWEKSSPSPNGVSPLSGFSWQYNLLSSSNTNFKRCRIRGRRIVEQIPKSQKSLLWQTNFSIPKEKRVKDFLLFHV